MKAAQILTITAIVLILVSLAVRYYAFRTGSVLMFTGTLYICLYYLFKAIKCIKNKSGNLFINIFQVIIALMAITIFAKYSYFNFGYFIGYVIIPLFLITTVIYWTKASKATFELTIVSFVFSLLCIPLFSTFYSKYFPNNVFDIFYTQKYIEPYDMGIDYYNFYSFWNIDRNFESSEEIDEMYIKAHTLSAEDECYEEAIEIYRQIIDVTPPNAFMYYRLAKCYYFVEQFDLSIPAIDIAIKLGPRNAEYYNLRATVHIHINNADLALKDIKKSLKLKPTDANTYLLLSGVYYYLYKDYPKAYNAMEKVELYDAELAKDFLSLKQEIEEKLAQE